MGPVSRLVPALLAWAIALVGRPVAADPPDDALLIDGLCALIGERAEDEGSASPVLLDEVGLEAHLLLVRRLGPSWREVEVDDATWIEARRIAALRIMFAHQARLMGETVDPELLESQTAALIDRAGGSAAMQELLAMHGASDDHLWRWVEDALLAAQQVRFERERLDPPSDRDLARRFEDGGHGLEGQEFEDVRAEYRRTVQAEQTRKAILVRLGSTLQRGLLRLIR
jgi:hypothetical protein